MRSSEWTTRKKFKTKWAILRISFVFGFLFFALTGWSWGARLFFAQILLLPVLVGLFLWPSIFGETELEPAAVNAVRLKVVGFYLAVALLTYWLLPGDGSSPVGS